MPDDVNGSYQTTEAAVITARSPSENREAESEFPGSDDVGFRG